VRIKRPVDCYFCKEPNGYNRNKKLIPQMRTVSVLRSIRIYTHIRVTKSTLLV
jgi:hypothetical protein